MPKSRKNEAAVKPTSSQRGLVGTIENQLSQLRKKLATLENKPVVNMVAARIEAADELINTIASVIDGCIKTFESTNIQHESELDAAYDLFRQFECLFSWYVEVLNVVADGAWADSPDMQAFLAKHRGQLQQSKERIVAFQPGVLFFKKHLSTFDTILARLKAEGVNSGFKAIEAFWDEKKPQSINEQAGAFYEMMFYVMVRAYHHTTPETLSDFSKRYAQYIEINHELFARASLHPSVIDRIGQLAKAAGGFRYDEERHCIELPIIYDELGRLKFSYKVIYFGGREYLLENLLKSLTQTEGYGFLHVEPTSFKQRFYYSQRLFDNLCSEKKQDCKAFFAAMRKKYRFSELNPVAYVDYFLVYARFAIDFIKFSTYRGASTLAYEKFEPLKAACVQECKAMRDELERLLTLDATGLAHQALAREYSHDLDEIIKCLPLAGKIIDGSLFNYCSLINLRDESVERQFRDGPKFVTQGGKAYQTGPSVLPDQDALFSYRIYRSVYTYNEAAVDLLLSDDISVGFNPGYLRDILKHAKNCPISVLLKGAKYWREVSINVAHEKIEALIKDKEDNDCVELPCKFSSSVTGSLALLASDGGHQPHYQQAVNMLVSCFNKKITLPAPKKGKAAWAAKKLTMLFLTIIDSEPSIAILLAEAVIKLYLARKDFVSVFSFSIMLRKAVEAFDNSHHDELSRLIALCQQHVSQSEEVNKKVGAIVDPLVQRAVVGGKNQAKHVNNTAAQLAQQIVKSAATTVADILISEQEERARRAALVEAGSQQERAQRAVVEGAVANSLAVLFREVDAQRKAEQTEKLNLLSKGIALFLDQSADRATHREALQMIAGYFDEPLPERFNAHRLMAILPKIVRWCVKYGSHSGHEQGVDKLVRSLVLLQYQGDQERQYVDKYLQRYGNEAITAKYDAYFTAVVDEDAESSLSLSASPSDGRSSRSTVTPDDSSDGYPSSDPDDAVAEVEPQAQVAASELNSVAGVDVPVNSEPQAQAAPSDAASHEAMTAELRTMLPTLWRRDAEIARGDAAHHAQVNYYLLQQMHALAQENARLRHENASLHQTNAGLASQLHAIDGVLHPPFMMFPPVHPALPGAARGWQPRPN